MGLFSRRCEDKKP